MKKLFYFLILVATVACVPNRKITYMQADDLKLKTVPEDTILRSYDLINYEYKIQPQDILHFRVSSLTQEEYDFLSDFTLGGGGMMMGGNNLQIAGEVVDNDGNVEFPVVGKVLVAGLTLEQIQDKMQSLALEYFESPVIKVRLLNYRFTLLGEVNGEGTIPTMNTRITIPEAIGLAGGLSELADRSKIKVIRQKNGQSHVFYINLLEEDLLASEHYYVHQNDIIVVPPLRQRPFRQYFSQNFSILLSTASLAILVVNLVNQE